MGNGIKPPSASEDDFGRNHQSSDSTIDILASWCWPSVKALHSLPLSEIDMRRGLWVWTLCSKWQKEGVLNRFKHRMKCDWFFKNFAGFLIFFRFLKMMKNGLCCVYRCFGKNMRANSHLMRPICRLVFHPCLGEGMGKEGLSEIYPLISSLYFSFSHWNMKYVLTDFQAWGESCRLGGNLVECCKLFSIIRFWYHSSLELLSL